MNLKKVYKLDAELEDIMQKEKNEYFKVTDGKHERVYTLERDGKQQEITEGVLWEEVRMGGQQATAFLTEKYPIVFEIVKERELKQVEVKQELTRQLGFDPSELNAGRIIKMSHAIIKYELDQMSLFKLIVSKLKNILR